MALGSFSARSSLIPAAIPIYPDLIRPIVRIADDTLGAGVGGGKGVSWDGSICY